MLCYQTCIWVMDLYSFDMQHIKIHLNPSVHEAELPLERHRPRVAKSEHSPKHRLACLGFIRASQNSAAHVRQKINKHVNARNNIEHVRKVLF